MDLIILVTDAVVGKAAEILVIGVLDTLTQEDADPNNSENGIEEVFIVISDAFADLFD